MELARLYTLSGTTVVEKVGKVQDGERIKIEFRGRTAGDSPIAGKAHGSNWILIGPSGPGETSAVQEIVTPGGERLVVELRGYTVPGNGDEMEIRASGIIRSGAASFADLNGHVAVVVQTIGPQDAISVTAYSL
jgi:hypothetical protein